ncbi:MAG: DUF1289 domain-containing protein [Methylococcaceae bacterium]|nr:DUF1289 domain-containing protein [Methylococcaceae bacterium]
MKFNPCISGKCTDQGTYCEGCGRSHVEISETKKLIMSVVSFAQSQGYENHEEFADFIGKTILKKLQNPV